MTASRTFLTVAVAAVALAAAALATASDASARGRHGGGGHGGGHGEPRRAPQLPAPPRPSSSSPAPSPTVPAILQPLSPRAWSGRGKAGPTSAPSPVDHTIPLACSAPRCCSSLSAFPSRRRGPMANPTPRPTDVLSALPAELSSRLFAKARLVTLAADETLFLAGDAGDGCYGSTTACSRRACCRRPAASASSRSSARARWSANCR